MSEETLVKILFLASPLLYGLTILFWIPILSRIPIYEPDFNERREALILIATFWPVTIPILLLLAFGALTRWLAGKCISTEDARSDVRDRDRYLTKYNSRKEA